MAYCGPRGIPLHTFLEWPPESQAAALHWQEHEATRCSACGTHEDDWFGHDGQPIEPQHWHGRICPGCRHLQAAREALDAGPAERGLHLASADGPATDCPLCQANS